MEQITTLLKGFDLKGAVIVYFSVLAIKKITDYFVYLKDWIKDLTFLLLAIVLSITYGTLTRSALCGLEAFAGSQALHLLVRNSINTIQQKQK